jgi:hypothetical protein
MHFNSNPIAKEIEVGMFQLGITPLQQVQIRIMETYWCSKNNLIVDRTNHGVDFSLAFIPFKKI